MSEYEYSGEFDFENENRQEFQNDINTHADKLNDAILNEENVSQLSEVSTNEKSKKQSTITN